MPVRDHAQRALVGDTDRDGPHIALTSSVHYWPDAYLFKSTAFVTSPGIHDSEQRAHFRLRYPENERPLCLIGERRFEVVELSEGGMRLHLNGGSEPWAGPERFRGVLELADGEHLVAGDFLRDHNGEAVYQLRRGVDMRCMLNEQKRLVRKYPALFGREAD